MITPTVGRVVHYTPGPADVDMGVNGEQKLAAIIATVWSDTCVNLFVIDANGSTSQHNRTSVRLLQEGEEIPEEGPYCEWMDYQKGQAAKTEDIENNLEARFNELCKDFEELRMKYLGAACAKEARVPEVPAGEEVKSD